MISFIFQIFFRKMFLVKTIWWKIFFESISIFLTVSVIFYASEAFVFSPKSSDLKNVSLFVFLLVGEVTLIIPMSFAERFLTYFIDLKNQQFYQTLLGLRLSPIRFILSRSLVDLLFPILRVCFILFYSFIFLNFQFNFLSLLLFIFLELWATILFATMALVASLVYMKFNRGIGVFYMFQSFSAILAGVYFPTTIFPAYIKFISTILPQTSILQAARSIFLGHQLDANIYLSLCFWPVFLYGIWFFLNNSTISSQKKKARFF